MVIMGSNISGQLFHVGVELPSNSSFATESTYFPIAVHPSQKTRKKSVVTVRGKLMSESPVISVSTTNSDLLLVIILDHLQR